MSTILIVEDMEIIRAPIAMCLGSAGYETLTASNGQEAWEILKTRCPDLILLDVAMPVMDGITLLGLVREHPGTCQIPVILLTATSDKHRIVEAARLGIQECLLKTQFSLKKLLERVQRHAALSPEPESPETAEPVVVAGPTPAEPRPVGNGLPKVANLLIGMSRQGATSAAVSVPAGSSPPPPQLSQLDLPHLLTKDSCLARITNCLQTKALAGVISQVIGMAASPRGDMADLASMIMRDPLLSARVLQVANSAAYVSNRGPASTVQEAVRRVGCSTVRNIAVALGVFDVMPESSIEGFNPIRQWQHALGVATLCEHLVADNPAIQGGTAYLTGLCHDLGEVLFYRHFAKEYQQVLEAELRTGGPRRDLERIMLGATREELTLFLLQNIGLPGAVQCAIAIYLHHDAPKRGEGQNLANLLRLADAYANGMLLALRPQSTIQGLTCTECRSATGIDHPPVPNGMLLRSEVLAITGMLAPQPSGRTTDITTPLYPKRDIQVLLVRAPGLSTFDPVQAALESLASVTVASTVPQGLAAWDALVVLAPSSGLKGFTSGEIKCALATSADPVYPLLWLVGQTHAGLDTRRELQPTIWPIALEEVEAFIQAVVAERAETMTTA